MLWFKFIQKLIKVLNQDATPGQIAGGLALGAVVGLIPKLNLLALAVVLLILFLRVNIAIATLGTAMAALAILSGSSTVLYTLYPPLQAHPTFYIGATLLIVGSWIWCAVMLRTAWCWRRENRDRPLPLAIHGMLVTVIIWILATAGLAVEVGKSET